MKPKKQYEETQLFQPRLDQIIDLKHPLCILVKQIAWKYFENRFGNIYIDKVGRSDIPTHVKVYLGRVYRDIMRKSVSRNASFSKLLDMAERLLQQEHHDKNKFRRMFRLKPEKIQNVRAQNLRRRLIPIDPSLLSDSQNKRQLVNLWENHLSFPCKIFSFFTDIRQFDAISG